MQLFLKMLTHVSMPYLDIVLFITLHLSCVFYLYDYVCLISLGLNRMQT